MSDVGLRLLIGVFRRTGGDSEADGGVCSIPFHVVPNPTWDSQLAGST